jgi:hypothetical protein
LPKLPRILSVVAVAAFSLAVCAGASAKVVTVGSPLTQEFTPTEFGAVITSVNSAPGELGALATSPVDGVVVRWRILDAAGGPFKLRVLRPAGAGSYIGVGRSGPEKPTGLGLQTFATNLPIQAGDTIGIDNTSGTGSDFIGLFLYPGSGSPSYSYLEPTIAEGLPTAVKGTAEGYELAFNADVQPAPTVASIAPGTGATGGGTSVTITGTDFEGASAVKFGSISAQSFTVNSESSITAVAPASAGATAVPVSVTTVAGTATSPQAFTYADPPAPPAPPLVAATCKVPKLSGKTLKAAKKRIRAADCKVGKLTKRRGATAKDGEVVRQVPKPGATVPTTTQVKVTLAPS